jgi:hypothetical protein
MRLTARETVAMETPARRATSRMLTVAGRLRSDEFFRGVVTAGGIVSFPVFLNQSGYYTSCKNYLETVICLVFNAGWRPRLQAKRRIEGGFWKAFPKGRSVVCGSCC